ncbi:TPA: ABC transporter permease [Enterococcus faecalis]
MSELYVITVFNIKKMMKSWPIWFFALLLIIVVGGGLFYFSDTKKLDLLINSEDKNVDLSNVYRANDFYENYNINKIEEQKKNPKRNEISITIKPKSENVSGIKFEYGDNISKDSSLENSFVAILQKGQLDKIVSHSFESIREYKIENTHDKQYPSEILSFIVLFLTYGFTLLCGATITNSVASEKISKVSDLIVYRTNPVKLVYGKILALFTVVGTIICTLSLEIWILIISNGGIRNYISEFLKKIELSSKNIMLVLVMSVCAVVVYTLMYAVVGMLVQDQQQLQFAQLPVTLILIISFVSTYFSILHPNTIISSIGVYIPIMAPFLFVDKILNGFTQMEFIGFIGTEMIFLILCNFLIMRVFIPKKYY